MYPKPKNIALYTVHEAVEIFSSFQIMKDINQFLMETFIKKWIPVDRRTFITKVEFVL